MLSAPAGQVTLTPLSLPILRRSVLFCITVAWACLFFGQSKAQAQTSNAWNVYKGGVWQDTNNWTGGSYPNGAGAKANLGSAITQDSTIRLGANAAVGNLIISNGITYKVTGLYDVQFSALGPANATVTQTGTGSAFVSSKLDLLNNLIITQASSGTLTLQGDINVAQKSVTKYGSGTLELDGINSFGNGLYVNEGTVRGFMEQNLGNGTNVTINGGTLSVGGNIKTDGTRVYTIGANGGAISVDAGSTMNFANGTLLGGSGTLTFAGNGTVVLGTDNSSTFTGNVIISGGTVQISAENNLGASTGGLTLNGGTLEVTTGFTASGSKVFTIGASGGTLNVDANQTLTLGSLGDLAGSGNLTENGPGTLVLSGNNSSFTGTNIISAGTVKITAENNLGAVGNSVILNGGTLEMGGSFTLNSGKAVVLQNDSTLLVDSSFTTTIGTASQLKGASTLTKDGAGTLAVTASQNSTWTGGLIINNGLVSFSSAGTATGLTNITVRSGATLTLDNSTTANNNRIAAGITMDGGTMNLVGRTGTTVAETVGALTLTGGGSLIQAAMSGTAASTTLTFASLNQSDPSATVDFENGGAGTLGSTGSNPKIAFTTGPAVNNSIIGGWAVARGTSAGTLEFATTNAQGIAALGTWGTGNQTTWGATINAKPGANVVGTGTGGKLQANRSVYSLTLAANRAVDLGGFTLTDVSGGLIAQGNSWISNGLVTVGSAGVGGNLYAFVDGASSVFTNMTILTNNAGGTVGLVKSGSGTMLLGKANAYTGGTYINDGTLKLGIANGVATTSALSIESGATFNMAGFNQTVGSIAGAGSIVNGGGTLTEGGDNTDTTFSGVISGTGGLTKTGSGTLTLSGANTFTGSLGINAGTVSVSQDSNLGGAASRTVLNGGTLNISESFTAGASRTLNMAGAGTLDINDGQTLTFTTTNDLTGSGNLTKSGNGTVIFAGASNYTGNLVINGGEVKVQGLDTAVDALLTSNRVANLSGSGGTLTWAYSNNNFTNQINYQPNSPSNIKLGFDNTSGNSNVWYTIGPTTTTNLNWAGLVVKGGNVQLSSDHTFVGTSATTLEVQGGSLYLAGGTSTGGKTLTVSGDVTLTGGSIYGGPGGGSHGTIVTSGNVISDGTVLINGPSFEMRPGAGLTTTISGTTPLDGVYTFTVNGPGTVRLDQSMSVSAGLSINQGTLLLGANDRLNDDVHITMANGTTFATGGHQDTVGQLTLSGNATLDLGSGTTSLLAFADSSAQNWGNGAYTLTITNYSDWAEYVYFGTTSSGLTSNQLASIVWDDPFGVGSGIYDGAYIDSDGRIRPVAVPETKTVVAVLLLAGIVGWRERKQVRKLWSLLKLRLAVVATRRD